MPADNIFSNIAIGMKDPGAFRRMEREDQRFAAAQLSQQQQRIQEASMQVLRQAPQGSQARAMAILALKNSGLDDDSLLQALSQTGPGAAAPKRRTVSPGSVVFREEPGGLVEEARVPFRPREPKQPTTTEGERNLQRILELQTQGSLDPREEQELKFRDEQRRARNQPDPMKTFMAQALGLGTGVTTPDTRAPKSLDKKQTKAIDQARQALESGRPRSGVRRLLKERYGLSQEQIEAAGL